MQSSNIPADTTPGYVLAVVVVGIIIAGIYQLVNGNSNAAGGLWIFGLILELIAVGIAGNQAFSIFTGFFALGCFALAVVGLIAGNDSGCMAAVLAIVMGSILTVATYALFNST